MQMKAKFIAFAIIGFGLFQVSCSPLTSTEGRASGDVYNGVSESERPRWSISDLVYQSLNKGQGHIEISLSNQELVLRDQLGRVALKSDCSTGIDGKETPTGIFLIKEMLVDKRSNLYGRYVSKSTGEIVVERSWEVNGPPPGTRYRGIEMPYWMRLTSDGVGIHTGDFPRGYRSSFGCIRMPAELQPKLFEKCSSGMKVEISH